MIRSWRLGRLLGIDLYMHWSFLLIPLFAVTNHLASGVDDAIIAGLVTLLAFGCIVLHEYGHALMARVFNIPTRDITLYPIGGVARLEGVGHHPGQELLIAVAGPMVNVVIAAALWGGLVVAGQPINARTLMDGPYLLRVLEQLVVVNVGLVVFNLIPAFPMDGGRVLRALLELATDRVTATLWAVRVASLFAILFGIYGLVSGGFGLMLIAFFLWQAGRQELGMAMTEANRRRVQWHPQPMQPVQVQPLTATGAMFTGYTWDERLSQWVEWRNGHPVRAV